ncbi:MAG: DUF3999 family protein [Opitutaceae bacterium]|nr:DUF3999 family protein [Opitutaceae bacterium]
MRNWIRSKPAPAPRRNHGEAGVLALLAVLVPLRALALEANEWKYRQPFTVTRPGVVKFALPPATLDVAQPRLGDLRLVDGTATQIPYLLQPSTPAAPATRRAPRSFRSELTESSTQLYLETGYEAPVAGISLVTPAPAFLKAARVEVSANGRDWRQIATGIPLFRQFGAEELRLKFEPVRTSHLRVTLDDSRTRPIPITSAALAFAAGADAGATLPLPVRITNREEFASESVLTLDLGAQHVPLSTLEFTAREPLFARPVTIGVRELRGDVAVERTLFRGSIYRLAIDDLPARAQLSLPIEMTAPSRELLIHIHNGDSPPLGIEAVKAAHRPIWLLFHAPAAGIYTLLTGNPDVGAPRYDLGMVGDSLKQAAAGDVALSAPALNPSYRRPDTLADTPLTGAPLDPRDWNLRKPVRVASAGVQQLELDPDVLAGAQREFGDLRLLRDGTQVPFILERPALSRSVAVVIAAANDPKRPRLSRWHLKLPRPGLPITQLTLTTTTPLFERHLRLYEVIEDVRSGRFERALAVADWRATPGNRSPLVLAITLPPIGDTLVLETDNGDNPAINLAAATAVHPVTRLLFKTDPTELALYYGNPRTPAARYDVALVAPQILSAEKHVATLGPEEKARVEGWARSALQGARGGVLFWSVLALVVVALLVVVARLLPKPPAAP